MNAPRPTARRSGRSALDVWRRTFAMLVKEFIQLRRDRVSFAMIVMIPLVQLLLFGYAINTNPRHLPTAVLLQEQSDLGRSILKALENTQYFKVTHQVRDEAEFDRLLASGHAVSQVAEELHLSVKTVSTYRARVLEKMNLRTNAELTVYAVRNHLVE